MSSHIKMLAYLPLGVREAFISMKKQSLYSVDEIRLRRNCALAVCVGGRNLFVTKDGRFGGIRDALVVTDRMMDECIKLLTASSRYALDNAIAEGYIPVEGMRAGICGRALIKNGRVETVSVINCIDLRITRRVDGFALPLYKRFSDRGISGTLVIAPPACGKTTFLRSLIVLMCDRYRVAVCDSRGELICEGLEKLPLDVMSFCPKDRAVEMLTRVMNPQIIICDELGYTEEQTIMQNASCGVPIVASVHATDTTEALRRPFIKRLCDAGIFDTAVTLTSRCGVFDAKISDLPCREAEACVS